MKKDTFFLSRKLLLGIIAIGLVFGMLSEVKAVPYFQGKVITFLGNSSAPL
ncbi:MAG: hypothetical protein QME90_14435 [Thermodesulfobacteriota bacterium]|nr:hypothetical protein [Thermodesulfobacteriota bacterium]